MKNSETDIHLSSIQQRKIGQDKNVEEIIEHVKKILEIINTKHQLSFSKTLEGGTSAFTCVVKNIKGEEFVTKISFNDHETELDFQKELAALELANGNGYVKLLIKDQALGYAILEKLGKPLSDFDYPIKEQIKIISTTLVKSWKKIDKPTQGLIYGTEILDWFQNFIDKSWKEYKEPYSPELKNKVDKVILERRNNLDFKNCVLVHGDAHNKNILKNLSKDENDYSFIDPDGIVCEPEYDLGVLMREWIDELLLNCKIKTNQRLDLLSKITGLNKVSIWHWGLIQLVATGLVLYSINEKNKANKMFKVANEYWIEK